MLSGLRRDQRRFLAGPPQPLRRYREIAQVLIRYGLVDVVEALHLRRYLGMGARLLPKQTRIDVTLPRATRFRLTLEALGPTFVKFGQALSVRSDVLSPDLITELVKLQDRAAPLAPGMAEAVIESELQKPLADVFQQFDPVPVGGASMATVHRARLLSGEEVAVKVRRPGIAAVIDRDLHVLSQLARLAERYVPALDVLGPADLVEEFRRTIHAEQDFVREARNIERCGRNFAGDARVRVPRVYWPYTTSAVLTLEYLDGLKLTELQHTVFDLETRRMIAECGAAAMTTQILVHGFFHADPHPGNLMIWPGPVIGFLDFGIVGRIDSRTRVELARMVRAVGRRDAEELAAVAVEMTAPQADVDMRSLAHDLNDLIDAYADVPLGRLSMTEVLGDVVGTASRHRLRFPTNLMLLIKAVMTIESVGRDLDPEFKLVEHTAPLAERLWTDQYSSPVVLSRAHDALRKSVGAAYRLPQHLERLVRKAGDGRWQVQFVHRNLDHFIEEMDRSSNRLSFAVVIGSLVVGSSLVLQHEGGSGYSAVGLIGFLIAAILSLGLAIGIARSGRL